MPVATRTVEQPAPFVVEQLDDQRAALGIDRLDDDRLALAVRRDGERAFELLYQRLHGPLYGYCCGMLGDGAEAEEALQETMIRAYATLRKGGAELRIKPWLYTVARNVCIDRIRQRRAIPLEINEEEHDLLAPSAAEAYEQRERLEMLVTDMHRLSERQRSALILRELSGLSLIEIGEILATTPDRAKALISEARRSLRRTRAAPALAASVPVLPAAQSKTILAHVLATGGAAKAGAGAGSLLTAVTAKKLAGAVAVIAIGAGTVGVAERTNFGPGSAPVAAGSTSAAAATAAGFALGPGAASAVSERPVEGVAPGGTPDAGPGGGNGPEGNGSGSGAPGSSGATPGATSPGGGSAVGGAQNTVNGVLGTTQQTVNQTVNQAQGTLNDTVRDVTGGARDTLKGVTDGVGVNAPRLGDGKGILGE